MFPRSLLLVLLVLVCLQSFTSAERENGPDKCCFRYQSHRIPVRVVTAYKETDRECNKPGVIFTVKRGLEACADPEVQWVKNIMNTIDQRKPTNLA